MISREDVEKKVISTFKDIMKTKKDEVALNKNFRDELGIDSIQLVSMITIFENTLNFDSLSAISELDFSEILTGNDIVDVVMKYQKSGE